MRVIELDRPTTCADCGRPLFKGNQARYYSRDKIYCYPPCSPPPGQRQDQAPARRQPPTADAVLLFLQRLRSALDELIDNLVKK